VGQENTSFWCSNLLSFQKLPHGVVSQPHLRL
jgi:hypothetical protein